MPSSEDLYNLTVEYPDGCTELFFERDSLLRAAANLELSCKAHIKAAIDDAENKELRRGFTNKIREQEFTSKIREGLLTGAFDEDHAENLMLKYLFEEDKNNPEYHSTLNSYKFVARCQRFRHLDKLSYRLNLSHTVAALLFPLGSLVLWCTFTAFQAFQIRVNRSLPDFLAFLPLPLMLILSFAVVSTLTVLKIRMNSKLKSALLDLQALFPLSSNVVAEDIYVTMKEAKERLNSPEMNDFAKCLGFEGAGGYWIYFNNYCEYYHINDCRKRYHDLSERKNPVESADGIISADSILNGYEKLQRYTSKCDRAKYIALLTVVLFLLSFQVSKLLFKAFDLHNGLPIRILDSLTTTGIIALFVVFNTSALYAYILNVRRNKLDSLVLDASEFVIQGPQEVAVYDCVWLSFKGSKHHIIASMRAQAGYINADFLTLSSLVLLIGVIVIMYGIYGKINPKICVPLGLALCSLSALMFIACAIYKIVSIVLNEKASPSMTSPPMTSPLPLEGTPSSSSMPSPSSSVVAMPSSPSASPAIVTSPLPLEGTPSSSSMPSPSSSVVAMPSSPSASPAIVTSPLPLEGTPSSSSMPSAIVTSQPGAPSSSSAILTSPPLRTFVFSNENLSQPPLNVCSEILPPKLTLEETAPSSPSMTSPSLLIDARHLALQESRQPDQGNNIGK